MSPAEPEGPGSPERAAAPEPEGRPGSPGSPDPPDPGPLLEAYWRRTLRFTVLLLAVWFVAGYVVSIVLAPWLNRFEFLGGPLGFWVAQNGAIYVFWLLILVYAVRMNRLDREFGVEESDGGAAASRDARGAEA